MCTPFLSILVISVAGILLPNPPLPPTGPQPPPPGESGSPPADSEPSGDSAPPSAADDGFPEVGPALFTDDGESTSAKEIWGSIDCQREDRARIVRSGGDPSAAADGRLQPGSGFRRLRVLDGDDFYGERCELGLNDHRSSPVALYREGERLITFASFRLAENFPLDRLAWQVVMQMKQSQPADSGGGSPTLALHAQNGRWRLAHPKVRTAGRPDVWSRPAQLETWTRFAFDVTYSTRASVGSVRIWADLNGDGDALDPGERTRRFELPTLKVEGPGTDEDGVAQGESIPSHLRIGLYHDQRYSCQRTRCTIDIDNVGIHAPPG